MGGKNYEVTIGIPFFNAKEYLEFAILSVINQTYSDWYLILIDDGSDDGSLAIANKYKCDSISIYSDGERKGLPYRLNEITQYANTPFLARMDADDIMHPERIEKQLTVLNRYPEIDVLGSKIISIDSANRPQGTRGSVQIPASREVILNTGLFCHPTVIGKTSWFKNNQYSLDYNRIEDLELWVRTLDRSHFLVLDEPLLFYREINVPQTKKYHETSASYRRILNDYANYISDSSRFKLYVKSYLKDIIYSISSLLGFENYLVARRNQNLSKAQLALSQTAINRAISCQEKDE